MVNIPEINMVMTGGWFMALFYPHYHITRKIIYKWAIYTIANCQTIRGYKTVQQQTFERKTAYKFRCTPLGCPAQTWNRNRKLWRSTTTTLAARLISIISCHEMHGNLATPNCLRVEQRWVPGWDTSWSGWVSKKLWSRASNRNVSLPQNCICCHWTTISAGYSGLWMWPRQATCWDRNWKG